MKVSKSRVEKIADDMVAVCKMGWDIGTEKANDRHLWNLWNFIHAEHAYDDNHPRFRNRTRLFPYDHSFELYPEGTNDNTMTTALRAAFKLAMDRIRAEK